MGVRRYRPEDERREEVFGGVRSSLVMPGDLARCQIPTNARTTARILKQGREILVMKVQSNKKTK